MHETLAILTAILLFLLFWVGLFHSLAYLSGWRSLAATYPCPSKVEGRTVRMGSVVLGSWFGYNNAVILTANPTGLRMALWLPFRLAHPPIFLPWAETQASGSRFLWVRRLKLRLDWSAVQVQIPIELVSWLREGLDLPIRETPES